MSTSLPSLLIVGRTNVGKTLLLLSFAEYCGLNGINLHIREPTGAERTEQLSLDQARTVLVSEAANETRNLQVVEVSLPKRKQHRRFRVVDTTGVTDSIHEAVDVRQGVAQTLAELRRAAMVLHVVDAAAIGSNDGRDPLAAVDLQIARYAPLRAPYALVANKMDLPEAVTGLSIIRRTLTPRQLLPVSALHGSGLGGVKRFVRDYL